MRETCQHEHTEPVILVDGQHVRDVCADCLTALPRGYGCPDCEWEELQTWGGHAVRVVRTTACTKHGRHAERQVADPCE